MDWQERTRLMLGEEALGSLAAARVAVVGVGGVGSVAAEMLARAGVGHILLIDSDCVSPSNINRQLPALHSTVGLPKIEVVGARLRDINPELELDLVGEYLTEENAASLLQPRPDVIVDAIDTLSPKVALIRYCLSAGIPLVSSMGAGAKLDSTAIRIADISQTRECPLAHMLRKRLHKMGITTGFDAVFSIEKPRREAVALEESRNKKSQVGTVPYMPAAFGLACAQAAIARISGIQ